MGLSRNKVAVPEGAAGTTPFWSKKKINPEYNSGSGITTAGQPSSLGWTDDGITGTKNAVLSIFFLQLEKQVGVKHRKVRTTSPNLRKVV